MKDEKLSPIQSEVIESLDVLNTDTVTPSAINDNADCGQINNDERILTPESEQADGAENETQPLNICDKNGEETQIEDTIKEQIQEVEDSVNMPLGKRLKAAFSRQYSGDYYRVNGDEATLRTKRGIHKLMLIAGLALLIVALFAIRQRPFTELSTNHPSIAYTYIWAQIIVMLITLYTVILAFTRYKIQNKIVKENAPHSGFKSRTFFMYEVLCVLYSLEVIAQIVLTALFYDTNALYASLILAASAAAIITARFYSHSTLKNATLCDPDGNELPLTPDAAKQNAPSEDKKA